VPKNKVVVNIVIFKFVFHEISPKFFSEEVGELSGLVCAAPRTNKQILKFFEFFNANVLVAVLQTLI
jgi:hypothetical protein